MMLPLPTVPPHISPVLALALAFGPHKQSRGFLQGCWAERELEQMCPPSTGPWVAGHKGAGHKGCSTLPHQGCFQAKPSLPEGFQPHRCPPVSPKGTAAVAGTLLGGFPITNS